MTGNTERRQSVLFGATDARVRRDANLRSEHGSVDRTDEKRHRSPRSPHRVNSGFQTIGRLRDARHESAHAKVSTVTKSSRMGGLTLPEFEFCRRSLSDAIQKCTDTEFLRLSVILSCLLNCFELLHVSEVSAILVLTFGAQLNDQECTPRSESVVLRSLQLKCGQILFEDSEGYLRFAHRLIPTFLRVYPVKGIDQSHAILAKACVREVECAGGLRNSNATKSLSATSRLTPFGAYASQHWVEHYRQAEKHNASLTARVHRMIWEGIVREGKLDACGRREAIDEALAFCAEQDFGVLCRSYTQSLASIDATSSSSDWVGYSVSDSGTASKGASDFDGIFSSLDITDTESDAESDDWSLI